VTTAIAIVACAWLAAALVYRWLAFAALARAASDSDSPRRNPSAPTSVALLRPLHGAPPSIEPCLESLFEAALTSGATVVIGFSRPDDPVCAVVERVRDRFSSAVRNVASTVRIGSGPPGVNPKVSNLIQMDARGESELVVLCDADVYVAPDFVARITEPFLDREIGLTTCPYRSVPARSLSSRVDALITNTHFIPSTCLAVRLEGLHFGLGAAIAVRRSALRAAGGLESLLGEAADDYHIARNVERAGWHLAWVPLLVEHRLEDEGWIRVASRHLRWAGTMRSLRPAGYGGVLATHGLVAALIAAAVLRGAALGLPLAWWISDIALAWPVRRALRLRGLDFLLLPIADLAAFGAWLGGFFVDARPPRA
jgi:ceramide glucosyltransferase